jgi:hypothetical protein
MLQSNALEALLQIAKIAQKAPLVCVSGGATIKHASV